MNTWVGKTIDLANKPGYLDELSEIYTVGEPLREGAFLSKEVILLLREVWKTGNRETFVRALLELKRFPYSEPYIGSLKTFTDAFNANPLTIARIVRRLEALDIDKIIDGLNRETMASRQLGQSFRNWSRRQFEVLAATDFSKAKGIAILDGSDDSLAKYAEENFGYKREKGLDLVAIAYGTPILGESKFISQSGGAQNGSFSEAVKFVKEPTGQAQHIAIIDGLLWADKYQNSLVLARKRPPVFSRVQTLDKEQPALSALLLKEFFESYK